MTISVATAQTWANCPSVEDTSNKPSVIAHQVFDFAYPNRCWPSSNFGENWQGRPAGNTHFRILLNAVPAQDEPAGVIIYWGNEFSNIKINGKDHSSAANRQVVFQQSGNDTHTYNIEFNHDGKTYRVAAVAEGNKLKSSMLYTGTLWAKCSSVEDTSDKPNVIAHQVFDFAYPNRCWPSSNFGENWQGRPAGNTHFRILLNAVPAQNEPAGVIIYWGNEFSNIKINGKDHSSAANRQVVFQQSGNDTHTYNIEFDRDNKTYNVSARVEGNLLKTTELFSK